MYLWKNTNILDNFLTDIKFTNDKSIANIAFLGSKTINIDEFTQLIAIFRIGVGMENVPIEKAKKKGIIIKKPSTSTCEYIYDETACFTCNLIFKVLYNNFGSINPWLRILRKAFKEYKLLIIGMGNIGSKVYDKMSCFLNVDSYDIQQNRPNELKSKISNSDCISLHIPLTQNNINFFDEKKLSWMKDHAVLINTARGALVNEDALYKELKSGRIRAAFDVFWEKPYVGKLAKLYPDPFFMTPHVGSYCKEYIQLAAKDVRSFIKEMENA